MCIITCNTSEESYHGMHYLGLTVQAAVMVVM